MTTKMFVNLPVKDVAGSIAFFKALGFSFNPRFTDDTAACMVISDHNYAMLLTHQKFKMFASKPISDTHAATEVMIARALDSKSAVDAMVAGALKPGAGSRTPSRISDSWSSARAAELDPTSPASRRAVSPQHFGHRPRLQFQGRERRASGWIAPHDKCVSALPQRKANRASSCFSMSNCAGLIIADIFSHRDAPQRARHSPQRRRPVGLRARQGSSECFTRPTGEIV